MSICVFCGHSNFSSNESYSRKFNKLIRKLIDRGVNEFYSGGYGSFDYFVLSEVSKFKVEFPHIQSYIILPYLDISCVSKYQHIVKEGIAKTMFPFEGRVMPRFAILERNKWMVNNGDIVVAYINHCWGGAYKMYRYAKQKGKEIINTDFVIE